MSEGPENSLSVRRTFVREIERQILNDGTVEESA